MKKHQEFTQWAIDRGVLLNNIAAHRFDGKGLGIIAETRLEAGSIILKVPQTALRNAGTVSGVVSRSLKATSVHGILAADLTLDKSVARAPWRAVMPSRQDFEVSMPLMWDDGMQALLPFASKALLDNQKAKLSRDWNSVHSAFPAIVYEDYLYNWLIVNTRTFHYISSSPKVRRPRNPDDCMALNPFADYFNHTDFEGCEVTFGPNGYTMATGRVIEKGEEIFISYGNHSNDFLLTEYGFILSENRWDEIYLDSFILPLLSEPQLQLLGENGFLGKYVLDSENVCYRTQVVLRLLCLTVGKWRRFVNGQDEGQNDQPKADALLVKILGSYMAHVKNVIERLKTLDCGQTSQRAILCRRWNQITLLLETTLSRIRSG